jgi:hypothetical protein
MSKLFHIPSYWFWYRPLKQESTTYMKAWCAFDWVDGVKGRLFCRLGSLCSVSVVVGDFNFGHKVNINLKYAGIPQVFGKVLFQMLKKGNL